MSATPQSTQERTSSLCNIPMDGYVATGIFLQLLREYFMKAERIENERLRSLRWVPTQGNANQMDAERSNILIEPVYRWDPRKTQALPAVLVRREATMLENQKFMGNNLAHPLFGAGDGSESHIMPCQGSHTLMCVSTEASISEVLAMDVARLFYRHGLVFTRIFPFNTFTVPQVGAIQRLEESDEHFAVPVALQYAYTDQWTVVEQEPLFKGVSLTGQGGDT